MTAARDPERLEALMSIPRCTRTLIAGALVLVTPVVHAT
jgi:hypothetical protein